MKTSLASHLLPSAAQVLETMFFTEIKSAVERPAATTRCSLSRTVEFQGPPDGELCLGLKSETAAALASSFLGVSPAEVTENDCAQVADELANMICGSVLSKCAPYSLFRLRVKRALACDRQDDFCITLDLPEGELSICAHLDRV